MRIFLNRYAGNENFIFRDDTTGVRLTLTKPLGRTAVLTDKLKRAIMDGRVVDLDHHFGVNVPSSVEIFNNNVCSRLGIPRYYSSGSIEIDNTPDEMEIIPPGAAIPAMEIIAPTATKEVVEEVVEEEVEEEVKLDKKPLGKKKTKNQTK